MVRLHFIGPDVHFSPHSDSANVHEKSDPMGVLNRRYNILLSCLRYKDVNNIATARYEIM